MSNLSIDELSILLLEPSSTQRKIITSKLAEAGNYNIDAVATTEAALKAMGTVPPDLVISSMYLGDMTGSELVSSMRNSEHLQDVPFMLISSETRHEYIEPIKQAGVVAILPKPFRVADLRLALEATAEFIDPEELDAGELDTEQVRVLVVDDSSTARKHISRLLVGMGLEQITTAVDGTEAVKLLEERLFDIVITDYNMPEMDGGLLTEHIRNNSAQASIPILMVTSVNDEAKLNSFLSQGVSAVCDKPFDANHVKHLLAQLLQ